MNGEETYRWIVGRLNKMGNAFIGWTDEDGTHFDILFSYRVPYFGRNIQGGIKPHADLFVSIMRRGSFGFEVDAGHTHAEYVREKLAFSGESTGEKMAELINGVKGLLQKQPQTFIKHDV